MELHFTRTKLEHVVDWEVVAKKYRALMGYTDEILDTGNDDENQN